tara:strand:+ start:3172 stop:6177 length:3006 start_codon:yes stop_codon:yes gene_type:complete
MKNNYKCCNIAVLIPLLYIFLQLETGKVYSQNNQNQQIISGTLSDHEGVPLPGVNVYVKGSSTGTMSNMDGHYSIRASIGDTLVYSYVGYQTLQKKLKLGYNGDLIMQPATDALSEVVINAGYYNTTERERTGNIARVTGEDIELQPVTSPIAALQGRMAGVEIVQQTGVPGAAPTIRIRGQNSLRTGFNDNGNLPLYIIDGVPVNSAPINSINRFSSSMGIDPLNGIDLSSIKSIEVLKDADATAIYGSRGANGVVLITTNNKNYSQQQEKFLIRFYSGVSTVSNYLEMLDTPQYLAIRREAFENDRVEPTGANAEDLVLWDQKRYTGWQKELFGHHSPTFNAYINYSGGNQYTNFKIGASYFKQGMVFPGDYSFQKKNISLNLNHRSKNQRFQTNLTINYGLTDNDLFSTSNFVGNALSLPPNAPAIYNEDGSLNWENSTWSNPLAPLNGSGKNEGKTLISSLNLSYKLFEGFYLKTNLGYNTLDSRDDLKLPIEIYDPAIWDRVSNQSRLLINNRISWIAEPQINYTKTFKKNQFDLLLGTTFQHSEDSRLGFNGTGYANAQLIGNLNAADAVVSTADQSLIYKYHAIFARIGYNFDKRLFLNLTGRRDGSSRFSPKNRFSNFGAVGAAWIFSSSKFLEDNLDFISFGKLRGSYGITGNDQIGDYRYLDAYRATPGPGGLYPTQLANSNFSWESTKKLEFALELGLFKNRTNLNLSWYRNRSSNQLVGYTLPSITGFTSVEANLPATVQNQGWELELSADIIKNKNFNWRSSINLSIPKNELIAFEDIEQSSYARAFEVGEPLSIQKVYHFNGLDTETGLYQIEDANDDGRYDYQDQVINEDLGRVYFGGLYNQLSYKNFSLSLLMEFVKHKGNEFYINTPGFFGYLIDNGQYVNGLPVNDGVQAPSQSIDALLAYENVVRSDLWISDASFLRMKTVDLSYKIPEKLFSSQSLPDIQLFVQGQNLFTITNYKGLDPQSPGSRNLPPLRTISAGLSLTF